MQRRPALGIGPDVRQEANVENGRDGHDHKDDDEKEHGTEKARKVFTEIHDRLHRCIHG